MKFKATFFLSMFLLAGIGLYYFASLPKYSVPEIKRHFFLQEEKYNQLVDKFNDMPDLFSFPGRIVVSSKIVKNTILKEFLELGENSEYLNFYSFGEKCWTFQKKGKDGEVEDYLITLPAICKILSLELKHLEDLREDMEALSVRHITKTLGNSEEISITVYSDGLAIGDYDEVCLYYSKKRPRNLYFTGVEIDLFDIVHEIEGHPNWWIVESGPTARKIKEKVPLPNPD
jgi:hypothetical protein